MITKIDVLRKAEGANGVLGKLWDVNTPAGLTNTLYAVADVAAHGIVAPGFLWKQVLPALVKALGALPAALDADWSDAVEAQISALAKPYGKRGGEQAKPDPTRGGYLGCKGGDEGHV